MIKTKVATGIEVVATGIKAVETIKEEGKGVLLARNECFARGEE